MGPSLVRLRLALPGLAVILLGLSVQTASGASCNSGRRCGVRILALGDSLTRGAVPSSQTSHPYAIQLRRSLQSQLERPSDISVDIKAYDYMGVLQKGKDGNGKTVDLTLVTLAKKVLAEAAAAQRPYRWVVVMAGINDLGAGDHKADQIMPRLIEVYNMALKSGASVLAISPFPNLFEARTSPNEAERLKLQQMMRDYVRSYQQQRLRGSSTANQRTAATLRQTVQAVQTQTQLVLQLLELPHQQFDFWQMTEPQRKQYQDDLLHLTPRGYDILGYLAATSIYKSTPGGMKGLCGC